MGFLFLAVSAKMEFPTVYLGKLFPSLYISYFWFVSVSCWYIYIEILWIKTGGYDKEEKAARAYDLAALKYWGPTATTNFPVIYHFFLHRISRVYLWIVFNWELSAYRLLIIPKKSRKWSMLLSKNSLLRLEGSAAELYYIFTHFLYNICSCYLLLRLTKFLQESMLLFSGKVAASLEEHPSTGVSLG